MIIMEQKTNFVHLHVHSDFSICDSTASVKALADRAQELGMTHLALTDHGNMFGVMEFIDACQKQQNPIKPIIGCEVYVTPGSRFKKGGSKNKNKYYHLVLLATNREGYLNLMKICSFAYTEGFYYRPRVDDELLSKYHQGLIALSGCVKGEIPQLILKGKTKEAEQKACYYLDIFGKNNFYLEIQDHGLSAELLKSCLSQTDLNKSLAAISKNAGIPLVATNDIHYIKQEDSEAHDTLLCIGTGKLRADKKRKKYHGDKFYFKSGEEMAELFSEYPEAIANTVKISERCVVVLPKVELEDLPDHLPIFVIPSGFTKASDYMGHIAVNGLKNRYFKEKEEGGDTWKKIFKRFAMEMGIIVSLGYTNHFLIVADYINWARKNDIPVGPGRGASAGSIVSYALGITDIDPIKYDLLFENFINPDGNLTLSGPAEVPERISLPDFDIDFGNKCRDEVIKYITEKYGKERVGHIVTFSTLGARAVIKSVARVLGISIIESEMLTKLFPRKFWSTETLQKAIDGNSKLQEMEANPKYAELFSLVRKLKGLNHHYSIHAAGLILSKSDLHNFVPLYRDARTGAIATQYSINHLENCGLWKFDYLGLGTLDVIKHTIELIRNRGGEYTHFNIESIPEDDLATFTLFQEGKTYGVFQFESDGIKSILKQVKPDCITDLIALNTSAGHAFNKSHAAAYTKIAYQTAYLKANFPAEFMAANLSNKIDSSSKDSLLECINETRKMGLIVEPPDINISENFCTVVDERIIYGFSGIKGIGDIKSKIITFCRNNNPFQSFIDFICRVNINTIEITTIEKLIYAGAFDRLGVNRVTILKNFDRTLKYAQNKKADKRNRQANLFLNNTDDYSDFEYHDFQELSHNELLKLEKQVFGFYFSE